MLRKILILMAIINILMMTGCKSIVNKMAFHPDTTTVISSDKLPENVEELYIDTIDNIKIQSYWIPNKSSDKILIYFHGNAGNISQRLPDLMQLSSFGVNVLGVGYRGYGNSQGKPSEQGIYIDGKSALNYVMEKLDFQVENIFILGRSIGAAVAIKTVQNMNISGLILVAPLTSGKGLAKASNLGFISFLAGNSFDNISRISNITSPLLVIHGTDDNVIPFEMGKTVFHEAKVIKKFIEIEGANHNNLSTTYKSRYWAPIHDFIMGNDR
jgi:uncharacterized protein